MSRTQVRSIELHGRGVWVGHETTLFFFLTRRDKHLNEAMLSTADGSSRHAAVSQLRCCIAQTVHQQGCIVGRLLALAFFFSLSPHAGVNARVPAVPRRRATVAARRFKVRRRGPSTTVLPWNVLRGSHGARYVVVDSDGPPGLTFSAERIRAAAPTCQIGTKIATRPRRIRDVDDSFVRPAGKGTKGSEEHCARWKDVSHFYYFVRATTL